MCIWIFISCSWDSCMIQIYSRFVVCDVIHVCCHSNLWCKVRHPMLGVFLFSMLFPWIIILICVTFISLNCVIKFKITFWKTGEETPWKKITLFNLSKCLGAPAIWRQNLRWSWGLTFLYLTECLSKHHSTLVLSRPISNASRSAWG